MEKPITIYGAPGSGSIPVEAALTLLGQPYDVIDVAPWDGLEARARLAKINPAAQVPALVTPQGELMTESAAMLIWLADLNPHARLAPALDDPRRVAFLRWMTFISASIYGLYWIRDDPMRIAADEAHVAVIRERTLDRIDACWRMMEAQVSPGAYVQGEALGVLDLYVAVVSRWGPRRNRFYAAAPRLGEVARRVDADPRLEGFWRERYPFVEGWEEPPA